ncbi:hypothetical protein TYRP_005260 [Tyrophagus putrescentiae]|nr:hypothetical protein TYRP_005260 [Tyrophagus putrescentiae]
MPYYTFQLLKYAHFKGTRGTFLSKNKVAPTGGACRLTLASLDLPRTPAASGLARSARETLGGGHSW